jgi:lantibiotic modifying enzyme
MDSVTFPAASLSGGAPHPPPARVWGPTLTGEAARRAREAVDAIGLELSNLVDEGTQLGAGVAGGDAGLAVFFHYLHRYGGDPGARRRAVEALDRSLEAAGSSYQPPTLYSGFAGVGWMIAHLQRLGMEEALEVELDEIDAMVLAHLARPARLARTDSRGVYDLIGGLVGLGVYAYERLPSAGGRECLTAVIGALEEMAERTDEGATWFTPPELMPDANRARHPRGWYNLGLAHGVPGVVALLAWAAGAGVDAARSRALMGDALRWLMSQRLPAGSGSAFSTIRPPGGAPLGPSRDAWCYGDPGVGIALLGAARAVGDPALERDAIEILRGAAEHDFTTAQVEDVPLCHGAAGLAHIYNRAFHATGDEIVGRAAAEWYGHTLRMRAPGTGIGGYTYRTVEEREFRHVPRAGLLEGSAGIALALMAGLTGVEPTWDRFLMTHVPEAATGAGTASFSTSEP